ncbi:MAG: hypothetical protein PHN45_05540 [Methylococcales bacterium]|nr:hypothetical protein [Methylococcales bacterium]MDD5754199.1 hypothetical protein [Methylococcales bacterium]
MIGGIFMIFVAIWIYQSAVRAKVNNMLFWVAGSAVTFFVVQFLLVEFDITLLESLRSSEGGASYEAMNGADRKNEGDFQGFGGVLESLFFELMPQITGFLAVAVIRNRFMLKEDLNITNLFSGLKEMFVGIKNSFKATANQE